MALGTDHLTKTTSAVFIPELWEDEVIVAREANLVAAKLFAQMNFVGKKGDTIHIPKISTLTTNSKLPQQQVTLQSPTEDELVLTINRHEEVSQIFEDILIVQQSYDLRGEYTNQAGIAIARKIDTDILALYNKLDSIVSGTDGRTVWNPAISGNGGDITDEAFRNMLETLDNADVPEDGRFMIIPPSQKNVLRGIPKFIEADKFGSELPVQKGYWGTIYGIPVYYTTRCPIVLASDLTPYRVCFLAHTEALLSIMQMNVRVQADYIQQYLGTLVTSDVIYDVHEKRTDHGIAFIVPK